MKKRSQDHQQLFWARVVVRKWLNIRSNESDYSADPEEEEDDDDYDEDDDEENEELGRQSRFMDYRGVDAPSELNDFVPRLRKQKSSTYRSQYINTKELRVCAATWNVGGKLPPDDLDIDEWLGVNEPADIYVLGLQEMVPLNAGNIFGSEDTRPVPKWENIIREALNRVRPSVTKTKCFSDPPSPSKFKPSDDGPDIEEEILFESDSDIGEEVHPLDEEQNICDGSTTDEIMNTSLLASDVADSARSSVPIAIDYRRQFSFPKWQPSPSENMDASISQKAKKLTRMLSGSERIGLSWPEPPLHLLSQKVLDRPTSFKSFKSFKSLKSFKTYSSFKSIMDDMPGLGLLPEIDLEALLKRKKRSPYVRIVSKQMVGIFITIWEADELKRNADVHEILRRTHFHSPTYRGLPKGILDHERIIWLGDLNFRISLSDVETKALISKKQWSKLAEKDQLVRELNNGAFGGWSEGTLNFPPTYKYEVNSDKYYGDDPKATKRTPAWCDRVLSYGKGMRLLSYRRTELKLSDHRPVTATYIVEVEAFSPKKLQRALTFTNAEIENGEAVTSLISWK
ncbi:hypothetical protein TSUD_289150 [Trifolium subterraneum]|uniref:Inositol polyphosphate-related phosphatase domain-containing protein n=1 Tax=Trifolium subterraneum TaxID=3900 RepID=A0A2Z6MT01_TRISU|nr:hypothetical protein TSUD_289150 [Trifolium subterraneum]